MLAWEGSGLVLGFVACGLSSCLALWWLLGLLLCFCGGQWLLVLGLPSALGEKK